jgi:hypothetical protein
MTQLHPITGRSTTMIRKHTIRTVVLAAAILAFSASAAQAMPQRISQSTTPIASPVMKSAAIASPVIIAHRYELSSGLTNVQPSNGQTQALPPISPHDGAYARSANANRFQVISPAALHGYQGPSRPYYAGPQIMSQAVDSPNAQQLPVYRGFTRTQAVSASDSRLNGTAILLGAGILAALMLLAAAATSHVKPGRVAQA